MSVARPAAHGLAQESSDDARQEMQPFCESQIRVLELRWRRVMSKLLGAPWVFAAAQTGKLIDLYSLNLHLFWSVKCAFWVTGWGQEGQPGSEGAGPFLYRAFTMLQEMSSRCVARSEQPLLSFLLARGADWQAVCGVRAREEATCSPLQPLSLPVDQTRLWHF